jgi:hypothetical protein
MVVERQPEKPASRAAAISAAALVLANVVPVAGVLFAGWDAFAVAFAFWAETLAVGALAFLKILTARGQPAGRTMPWFARLFLAPFFVFHFGLFMFVHGVFLLVLAGASHIEFHPARVAATLLERSGVASFAAAALLSHGVSFAVHWIGRGEYLRVDPGTAMIQPYGRVIVQHVTVLLGTFVAATLGSPVLLLVLLVALKVAVDLAMHRREHGAGENPAHARAAAG